MNLDYKWDVFISHAGEDKEAVAIPLAEILETAGLNVWLDKKMILIGDSLLEKIEEGLRLSKYGVVILSPDFFAKQWPRRELDGLLGLEKPGTVRILPVWHNVDKNFVAGYSSILSGRAAALTQNGLESVADEILNRVRGNDLNQVPSQGVDNSFDADSYPEVKIRRKFSDKDKLDYMRATFAKVESFFENGLKGLARQNDDIESDFQKITPEEFHCRIFVQGGKRTECRIWIDRDFGSDGIKYSGSISSNGSWNESVSIETDEYDLYLKPMGMPMSIEAKERMNPDEVARYLWSLLIRYL